MRPPDVRDVGFGLAGLLVGFLSLNERYQNPLFLEAAVAADGIARRISLPKPAFDEIELQKGKIAEYLQCFDLKPEQMLKKLVAGVEHAYKQRELELEQIIPSPTNLRFDSLNEIARLKSDLSLNRQRGP